MVLACHNFVSNLAVLQCTCQKENLPGRNMPSTSSGHKRLGALRAVVSAWNAESTAGSRAERPLFGSSQASQLKRCGIFVSAMCR